MWDWLWALPAVLLIWAMVLVAREVRGAGKDAGTEEKPQTLEERLAALDDETDGDGNS